MSAPIDRDATGAAENDFNLTFQICQRHKLQFLTITLETILTYKVLETLMSQSVLEGL